MTIERMFVRAVLDGDTLIALRTVGNGTEERRIRLAYLDAPETTQAPFGASARSYLRYLLAFNEPVNVTVHGTDKYDRLIGEVVRVRDYANCGLRSVVGGYAALWLCPQERGDYLAAQEIAQRKRVGIWRVAGLHQAPWAYRAGKP